MRFKLAVFPGIEAVIVELQRQNGELRELLANFSESTSISADTVLDGAPTNLDDKTT